MRRLYLAYYGKSAYHYQPYTQADGLQSTGRYRYPGRYTNPDPATLTNPRSDGDRGREAADQYCYRATSTTHPYGAAHASYSNRADLSNRDGAANSHRDRRHNEYAGCNRDRDQHGGRQPNCWTS
jgi:hypothetical protein